VPMCACGRGWLPLLLSASDHEIPVFTGVNGTPTVRRLSLAGVILGLPSPAFLRSPTPLRGNTPVGACARAANGHGCFVPPAVGVLSECSTSTPPSLAGVLEACLAIASSDYS
jgi:hypothetical protein